MTKLRTFAFAHPLSPEQLQPFRAAFPDTEFLVPDAKQFPAGMERAQGIAIHWEAPPIDELLSAAPALEWIHLRGAGIDRISTERLVNSSVVLTNGSGNHAPNIAEHVMALMLVFARQLPGLFRSQRAGQWQPPAPERVFELGGQSLVIVGFGAIGQELALRAAAFGMDVVGVRRSAQHADAPGTARVVDMGGLDDALATADHVVVSLPLTDETRGLISARRLGRFKPGAYFYNVGRGPVVDQDALLAALRSGGLAGAGLDVTDPEPLPRDSPLWTEPGVVITAHSAGITPRSFERWQNLLLDNLSRFERGEALLNVVDKRRGY